MAVETRNTLQLDPAISQRLRQLAEARHRSPAALAQEAVEEYVTRAERRAEYLQAGIAAYEHFRTTGLHVTDEEVGEWADKHLAGEHAPPPDCQV